MVLTNVRADQIRWIGKSDRAVLVVVRVRILSYQVLPNMSNELLIFIDLKACYGRTRQCI